VVLFGGGRGRLARVRFPPPDVFMPTRPKPREETALFKPAGSFAGMRRAKAELAGKVEIRERPGEIPVLTLGGSSG